MFGDYIQHLVELPDNGRVKGAVGAVQFVSVRHW